MKEVLEKAPEVVRGIRSKENAIERAAITVKSVVPKKGCCTRCRTVLSKTYSENTAVDGVSSRMEAFYAIPTTRART